MKDYEKHCQNLYETISSVWPDGNAWYEYTHDIIVSFVEGQSRLFNDSSRILNAGSGGSEYKVRGNMVHLDLAKNLIQRFPKYVVASVEDIPFSNSTFDVTICVGSVINYCDAVTALSEISRVLVPGGYLILEYERSQTGELWFSKDYSKSVVKQTYIYNNQHEHNLWLYSDAYINSALFTSGLKIITNQYYHSVSAIANRLIKDELKSGKIGILDKYVLPPIKKISAHNRIILCRKVISPFSN